MTTFRSWNTRRYSERQGDKRTPGSPRMLDGLFGPAYHLKYVDMIFRRVFGE
jgi:hypothetical protein